ncbi:MAG TPA: asparagine synthase (glutamine-hydrolyzing) [Hyphomicrobiaceae bacterium]|nr:asparagine synthase (glutamine-hydrolyzing) [Hyphomicrobiaceae bacterium]
MPQGTCLGQDLAVLTGATAKRVLHTVCGLFGFIKLGVSALGPEDIAKGCAALNVLAHRGPDHVGHTVEGNVFLGHRRLSILDPSPAGHQPLVTSDGGVALTANGEIYNFRELRAELGSTQWRSGSDSEVALRGYAQLGIERLAERMDGMYALVFHDRRRNEVILLRDRAGIKPLYFGRLGHYFLWASELKALQAFLPPNDLVLDATALYDFLVHRYVPAPKSIYRGIAKLGQAGLLTVSTLSGATFERRYWTLPASETPISLQDAKERLRSLLSDSVKAQLVSDVPLGVFLSGGVDSSIVLALTSRFLDRAQTFAIGFEEAEYDERPFARTVAARFGADHRERLARSEDIDDPLKFLEQRYDEPFADTSALPTYRLSRFAREYVTVALSGDGGDELFGGYHRYDRFFWLHRLQGPLSGLKGTLRLPIKRPPHSLLQRIGNTLARFGQFDACALYSAVNANPLPHELARYREQLGIARDYDPFWNFRAHMRSDLPTRKALQYVDFHTWLPDCMLTKVDRASMAASLEVRVPFLSRGVIEFAFSLPEELIYLKGRRKGLLKAAFSHDLPASTLARPKKGFGAPTSHWRPAGDGPQTLQELIACRRYPEHLSAVRASTAAE